MLQQIVGGGEREVKTPKWLRGRMVCPVLIDDELFWRTDELMARGTAPMGVRYAHDNPHRLLATYGPKGDPKQVVPRLVDINGVAALQDEMGTVHTYAPARVITYLRNILGSTALFFAYPAQEDGTPELIVCFQRGYLFDQETREEEDSYRVYAYISPIFENAQHFLTLEEIEGLHRFDGYGEGHTGFDVGGRGA